MKRTATYFFGILLLTATLASCKKDKQSKTELLTDKSWKIIKAEVKSGSGPFVDFFQMEDDCTKDDLQTFFTNNTYQITEGATKCDSGDPDLIDSGSWALTENETMLSIDGEENTIEQLDKNTLVVSYTATVSGTVYVSRITFAH